jgi:hypothetical protein
MPTSKSPGTSLTAMGSTLDNEDSSVMSVDECDWNDSNVVLTTNTIVETSRQESSSLRVIDRLWSLCEVSTTSSKLILPDSLNQPFYMPKHTLKSDIWTEREKRRADFLVQREISNRVKTLGSSTLVMLPTDEGSAKLNGKEV